MYREQLYAYDATIEQFDPSISVVALCLEIPSPAVNEPKSVAQACSVGKDLRPSRIV